LPSPPMRWEGATHSGAHLYPATREAKARGLLEPRSSGPALTTCWDPWGSLK
jgi:hypothetical protein